MKRIRWTGRKWRISERRSDRGEWEGEVWERAGDDEGLIAGLYSGGEQIWGGEERGAKLAKERLEVGLVQY